ncbi:hypothetical protein [Desulfobacter latus]|uniref:DUF4124 domain-containing protein n=1 Tax=Desulfobacter latus TaxID=2292 RepID=A0A850T029_9BACT|nr:hypothetical protein [Desulfobacter latus]NWH06884.1 hypothetical protein [Desulfobacter latus]
MAYLSEKIMSIAGIGFQLIFLFSLIMLFSSVSYAEMVMYRDANGVLCFSNTGPAVDSEIEKTYKETKGSVSFPKKYESVEKQELQEIDVQIESNPAEVQMQKKEAQALIQRQKDKEIQAQFEKKIAFEKRRLDEALRHYRVDCPNFRTRSGHSYNISSRGRNAHRNFCREKYDQIAKSIKLLEKDPEYYFYRGAFPFSRPTEQFFKQELDA